MQSKTTGETLHAKDLVRQFAWVNNGLLAGDDPELDPSSADDEIEMKREEGQKNLHRMAKGHDILQM